MNDNDQRGGDAKDVPLTERERAMRQRVQSLMAAAGDRKRRLAHPEKQELAILLYEISQNRIFARGDVHFASLKDYGRVELGETSTVKLVQTCAYGALLTDFADGRKLRAGKKELRPLITSVASAEAKQRCLVLLLAAEAKSGKAVPSAQVAACLEEAEREPVIDHEPLADPQPTGQPSTATATAVDAPPASIAPQVEPAKAENIIEVRSIVAVPPQKTAAVVPAKPTREVRQPEITPVNKLAPAVPASRTVAAPKPQGGTVAVTKKAVRYVPAHMLKGAPPYRKWYSSPNSDTIIAVDWIDWSRQWPHFNTVLRRRDVSLLVGIWFLIVFFATWWVTATKLRDANRAKPAIIAGEYSRDEIAAAAGKSR
ncbi:MAG: hypothetical protein M3Z64_04900 [Verrucomicrobiota bacterium]|nr:hypothetical protein [Verrucomicrobiota bacterium]